MGPGRMGGWDPADHRSRRRARGVNEFGGREMSKDSRGVASTGKVANAALLTYVGRVWPAAATHDANARILRG